MKKSIYQIGFLISIWLTLMPKAAMASDIEDAILSIKEPDFIRSLKPMLFPEWFMEPQKSKKITKIEIKEMLKAQSVNEPSEDTNLSRRVQRFGGTGLYARYFYLLTQSKNKRVLAVVEKNGADYEYFSKILLFCERKSKWQNCTKTALPQVQIYDFFPPDVEKKMQIPDAIYVDFELQQNGHLLITRPTVESLAGAQSWQEAKNSPYTPIMGKITISEKRFTWSEADMKSK